MGAVLQIEPIYRSDPVPVTIGGTDFIRYGEKERDSDDDPTDDAVGSIMVGCPLDVIDSGSHRTTAPIVKSIECDNDVSDGGYPIITETLHVLESSRDGRFLIPYRTRVRSGLHKWKRLTHVPSLNIARQRIVGLSPVVTSPIPRIIDDLVENDPSLREVTRGPIGDWVRDDLGRVLEQNPTALIDFTSDTLSSSIEEMNLRLRRTNGWDVTQSQLRDIVGTVIPNAIPTHLPSMFSLESPIARPLEDSKSRMIPHSANLSMRARLSPSEIPCISVNNTYCKRTLEYLDNIRYTDLNIDIVLSGGEIIFEHVNIAVDRIKGFDPVHWGHDLGDDKFTIEPESATIVLREMISFHPMTNSLILDEVYNHPVKMKFIKTLADEAMVMLYRYDSTSEDGPLLALYFDIALLSLAPLTLMFK